MPATVAINPRILEDLYCEALELSDEVRTAFDISQRDDSVVLEEDSTRVALSCEALRTTTRMMHALAWLLNHRAYSLGELSEFQLRRHGRLSPSFPGADSERMALLPKSINALIATTEQFYARLLRLDNDWHRFDPKEPSAIARLRDRITHSVALSA